MMSLAVIAAGGLALVAVPAAVVGTGTIAEAAPAALVVEAPAPIAVGAATPPAASPTRRQVGEWVFTAPTLGLDTKARPAGVQAALDELVDAGWVVVAAGGPQAGPALLGLPVALDRLAPRQSMSWGGVLLRVVWVGPLAQRPQLANTVLVYDARPAGSDLVAVAVRDTP